MKKLYIVSLLSFAACASLGAVGTENTSKVGYIKLEAIINPMEPDKSAHEWRDKVQDLQKEIQSRRDKLMAEGEKFRKDAEAFGTKEKSKLLSEEALKKEREALMKKQSELMGKEQSFRDYATQTSQKMQTDMLGKVEKLAHKLATQKGFDLVLAGGALYVAKNVDLTAEVLTALNKEYDAEQEAKKKAAKK